MRLIINKEYPSSFILYYIPMCMKRFMLSESRSGVLRKLDEYINKTLGLKQTSLEIINELINNLYIVKQSKSYVFDTCIKDNFKNTDYTLNELINLIEFGNLEIKGSKVFERTFDKIHKYLDVLYSRYRRMRGI